MMKKNIKNVFLTGIFLLSVTMVSGQMGIGTADPRGALDINIKQGDTYSYNMGLVLPTNDAVSKIRNAVPNTSVAPGTIVYDSAGDCIRLRQIPDWSNCLVSIETVPSGIINGGLVCTTPTITGTFAAEVNSYGTFTISYNGGNGKSYPEMNLKSMSVTGLKARLAPGYFQEGSGKLTFVVSGIPSGSGNAFFGIMIGGKSCAVSIPVIPKPNIAVLKNKRKLMYQYNI